MRAKLDRMITTHACPGQTDGQTNIMTIAPRFVITNASHAKNFGMAPLVKFIARPIVLATKFCVV